MGQIIENPQLVALALVSVLNLSLGVFVFCKNPRNTLNRIFLFLSASIVIWSLGTFFAIYFYDNVYLYDLSDKFTYIAGLLIAVSFYMFGIYYPYKSRGISSLVISGYTVFFVVFTYIALFTNWFVTDVFKEGTVTTIHHSASTYAVYSFVIVTLFIFGLRELWNKMKSGDGVYRQHFLTLILLVGFSIVLSLIFDLSFSAFDNYSYVAVGPISSVLLVFAIMRMIISKE